MATYRNDTLTVSLADFAANLEKKPKDFVLETIVAGPAEYKEAVRKFNKSAKNYLAVLNPQEQMVDNAWRILNIFHVSDPLYVIRGTGVKEK